MPIHGAPNHQARDAITNPDAEALKQQAWDRQPEESVEQFYWFKVFRDLGRGRRIADVSRLMKGEGKSNLHVYVWSAKNNWKARANEFDTWCDAQQRLGAADALRNEGEILEQNRRTFKSKEMYLADMAFDKVRQLLSMPVATDTWAESRDGMTILHKRTLVQPAHYFAAAALFKVASAIGRQALGIASEENGDVTPEQFKDMFYRHATQVVESMPVGALPPPPAQTAVKPVIDQASTTHPDVQATEQRQNRAYRPPRERPYEHNGNGDNGNGN